MIIIIILFPIIIIITIMIITITISSIIMPSPADLPVGRGFSDILYFDPSGERVEEVACWAPAGRTLTLNPKP